MLAVFLRGLAIGFSIAAPVGPIGLLCIRRTLAHGRAVGFVSGLGAATADALYGAVAGFGLTALSSFLVRWQAPMRLVGGAFLCYLGVRTFLARPASSAVGTAPAGAGDYGGAATLVAGVLIGSGLWWLILSGIASAFRGRITPAAMRWVNRLSGTILAGFGLAALFAR